MPTLFPGQDALASPAGVPQAAGQKQQARGGPQLQEGRYQPTSTKEQIPPYQPAISVFVPLSLDLTDASTLPKDRVERLQKILGSIEAQQAGSRANLLYMHEREKQRILAQAEEAEQALQRQQEQRQQRRDSGSSLDIAGDWRRGPAAGSGSRMPAARSPTPTMQPALSSVETDRTTWNMSVPACPGTEYNMQDNNIRVPDAPPRASTGAATPRGLAADALIQNVEDTLDQLRSLDAHIQTLRQTYNAHLDKERAQVESIGKRPEERGRERGPRRM